MHATRSKRKTGRTSENDLSNYSRSAQKSTIDFRLIKEATQISMEETLEEEVEGSSVDAAEVDTWTMDTSLEETSQETEVAAIETISRADTTHIRSRISPTTTPQ